MPLYSSWQADANWEKRHLRPGHRKAAGMASSAGTACSMELASSSGLMHHGPAVAHRSAVPGTRLAAVCAAAPLQQRDGVCLKTPLKFWVPPIPGVSTAGAQPRTVWGNPRPLCPLQPLCHCSPGAERRAGGHVSVRAMLGPATLIARSHTTAEGSRPGTNDASGRQLGGTSPPQPARVCSPHVQPGTMAQSCQHPQACHRCTVTLLCPC